MTGGKSLIALYKKRKFSASKARNTTASKQDAFVFRKSAGIRPDVTVVVSLMKFPFV